MDVPSDEEDNRDPRKKPSSAEDTLGSSKQSNNNKKADRKMDARGDKKATPKKDVKATPMDESGDMKPEEVSQAQQPQVAVLEIDDAVPHSQSQEQLSSQLEAAKSQDTVSWVEQSRTTVEATAVSATVKATDATVSETDATKATEAQVQIFEAMSGASQEQVSSKAPFVTVDLSTDEQEAIVISDEESEEAVQQMRAEQWCDSVKIYDVRLSPSDDVIYVSDEEIEPPSAVPSPVDITLTTSQLSSETNEESSLSVSEEQLPAEPLIRSDIVSNEELIIVSDSNDSNVSCVTVRSCHDKQPPISQHSSPTILSPVTSVQVTPTRKQAPGQAKIAEPGPGPTVGKKDENTEKTQASSTGTVRKKSKKRRKRNKSRKNKGQVPGREPETVYDFDPALARSSVHDPVPSMTFYGDQRPTTSMSPARQAAASQEYYDNYAWVRREQRPEARATEADLLTIVMLEEREALWAAETAAQAEQPVPPVTSFLDRRRAKTRQQVAEHSEQDFKWDFGPQDDTLKVEYSDDTAEPPSERHSSEELVTEEEVEEEEWEYLDTHIVYGNPDEDLLYYNPLNDSYGPERPRIRRVRKKKVGQAVQPIVPRPLGCERQPHSLQGLALEGQPTVLERLAYGGPPGFTYGPQASTSSAGAVFYDDDTKSFQYVLPYDTPKPEQASSSRQQEDYGNGFSDEEAPPVVHAEKPIMHLKPIPKEEVEAVRALELQRAAAQSASRQAGMQPPGQAPGMSGDKHGESSSQAKSAEHAGEEPVEQDVVSADESSAEEVDASGEESSSDSSGIPSSVSSSIPESGDSDDGGKEEKKKAKKKSDVTSMYLKLAVITSLSTYKMTDESAAGGDGVQIVELPSEQATVQEQPIIEAEPAEPAINDENDEGVDEAHALEEAKQADEAGKVVAVEVAVEPGLQQVLGEGEIAESGAAQAEAEQVEAGGGEASAPADGTVQKDERADTGAAPPSGQIAEVEKTGGDGTEPHADGQVQHENAEEAGAAAAHQDDSTLGAVGGGVEQVVVVLADTAKMMLAEGMGNLDSPRTDRGSDTEDDQRPPQMRDAEMQTVMDEIGDSIHVRVLDEDGDEEEERRRRRNPEDGHGDM